MKNSNQKREQRTIRKSNGNGARRSKKRKRNTVREDGPEFKAVRAMFDQFAKTHSRFDELVHLVEPILRADKRVDLEMAYAIATTLRPSRRDLIKAAIERMRVRDA